VYANTYVRDFRIDKFFTQSITAGRSKASDYYRPIQLTVYATIHSLAGYNPFWYHTMSILIHTLAGITAFFFFKTLLTDKKIAFIGSVLFLVHPVQTESVSYISGLSDPLYVLFFFLSLTLYLKKDRGKRWSTGSIVFLVLSILSKELGIVALGVVTLLAVTKRKEKLRGDIGFLIVYLLVGLFYLDLRFTVLKFQDVTVIWKGIEYGSNPMIRFATFFRNFFAYLGILVFPKDLFMERDITLPIEKNIFNLWTAGWFALQLLVGAVVWILGKRKLVNRSHAVIIYLAFLLCFVPFTGIVLLNGIFYEHFLYLPMAFFWVFIALLVRPLLGKRKMQVLLGIIILLFIARSYLRQWDWIDPVRFFRQTLAHAPGDRRIINNLGMELANNGQLDEAINTYHKGISIDPSIPNYYHNLGNAYLEKKDYAKAEEYYLKAIKTDKKFYFSYLSLLELYKNRHEQKKFDAFLLQTIQVFPRK
jgi:hypothetical protein